MSAEDKNNKLYEKENIRHSTTGTESTELSIYKCIKTGEEKIWLTYRKSEALENTPENMELLKRKYKELNPSSGWVISIDDIVDFINKGSFRQEIIIK